MDKKKLLIWSALASALLLILFLCLQWFKSPILNLEVKWILVAGFPVFVGLLYSGIIKNFKGFGIELETRLSDSVKKVEIVGKLKPSTEPMPEMSKSSMRTLHRMPEEEKEKIERLILEEGRDNYYNPDIIAEYIRTLYNLNYIEIRKVDTKEFVCLLPLQIFYDEENEPNTALIDKLLNSMKNKSLAKDFPSAIFFYIQEDTQLLEAYKAITYLFKNKSLQNLPVPVLNEQKVLIGSVTKQELESNISQQVLKMAVDKTP